MHRVGAHSRKRSLLGWHASALGSSVGDHKPRGGRALIFEPTLGRRTAFFRAGVESDGRLWCGAVDRVNDRFEQRQAIRWQAQARADDYTVVAASRELAFHRWGCRIVGVN